MPPILACLCFSFSINFVYKCFGFVYGLWSRMTRCVGPLSRTAHWHNIVKVHQMPTSISNKHIGACFPTLLSGNQQNMMCYSHYPTYDKWNSYAATCGLCVKDGKSIVFVFALVLLVCFFFWRTDYDRFKGNSDQSFYYLPISVAQFIEICKTKRNEAHLSFICGFAILWAVSIRELLFDWSVLMMILSNMLWSSL